MEKYILGGKNDEGAACAVLGSPLSHKFGHEGPQIEGNGFTAVIAEPPYTYVFHGTFNSNTSASGDLLLNRVSPTCTGTENITWNATLAEAPQGTSEPIAATMAATSQSTRAATAVAP